MIRLLRGIIDWKGIPQESLIANYQKLQEAKIVWTQPSDAKIYRFVSDFFGKELSLPSAVTLYDHFQKLTDIETQERLQDIKDAIPHEGANYAYVLRQVKEQQAKQKFGILWKEVQEIAGRGLEIGEGKHKQRLEGVEAAVSYFQKKSSDLLSADANAKTRGDLREATQEAWDDYQTAKENPDKAVGKFMGIDHIDSKCKGLKKGELWIHAAFAAELKTSLALNWAYNQATIYRSNVFYASLEMPYKQIRNLICTLHSSHPRWEGRIPLEYSKVRDGELSPPEEAFYKEVLDDFYTNPEYCRFEVWCPDHDVTMQEIRLETELMHKQMEVGMLVIDHGGLVIPDGYHKEYTIGLNSIVRDAKKLALQFNQGEGLPVLFLFQMNRQGKDDAEKNKGLYKAKALSYANEAEKSADVITTTYLDDNLRAIGRTICGCLKNRDNGFFTPIELGINFACRKIYQRDETQDDSEESWKAVLDGVV